VKAREVSAVHGAGRLRLAVKGTLGGKVASALWRQRRTPRRAVELLRAPRDPRPVARGGSRIVFLVPCGPGQLDDLTDVVRSVERFGGPGARVLVLDDATPDVSRAVVQARHPDVDVVRPRWPTGGPPRQSSAMALALRTILETYDADVICKLDVDALLTGPGLAEAAAEAFAADPQLGVLGTVGVRADGVPEDYTYDAWLLDHECRWSATVRDRVRRARAGTYVGEKVHGGVYVMSRGALEAMDATGDLDAVPPWWSQIPEDLWITLGVCAVGQRLASWGAPGDPIACASKFLPVPLDEIPSRGVLAVHSVRRGPAGEPEAEVRARLRAQAQASS
jgi:hypothetical protein